jgi:signal transduction histidine kinase
MWERLLDVQEEERRRIDQEIHDEMGGLLTSIQMKAQTAQFKAKNNGVSLHSLDELSELLNDLSVAARTIARQLHPRVLDTYGLSEAVSNLVNTIEEQHDLTIDVQNEVGSADDYSALVERTAYRVIQEALLNVVRHAQVDTATVRLRETDRHLLLHVIDDGVGFDPAEREEEDNYGLKGITDRVERLDGTVNIDTTVNEGTQITATIPLTTSSLPTTLRTRRPDENPNGG